MEVFRSFNAPLVFGAELGCAPDMGSMVMYDKPRRGQPFRFLNSGTYMGSAQSIREMLAEIALDISEHHSIFGASKHRLDDQRWFSRHYLRNKGKLTLDTGGVMFHTLHDVAPELLVLDEKQAGAIWSKYSKTSPSVIHGNGNGIGTFHDVSKRLVEAGWPPGAKIEATTTPL